MRLITIALTIFIFGSCGRKVPEGVVQQQEMKALLLDMHLADGQLAAMLVDSARMYRDAYYQAIFHRYAIDSATFERSINFYSSRPALLKTMYVDIEKQLEAYSTAEQQAIEKKYSAQRKADSIANARRTDSLWHVRRDSLDFKRKRYLPYLDGPDSVQYGQPVPVTYTLLKERMMEVVGLPSASESADQRTPPAEPVVPPALPVVPSPDVEETIRPTLTPLKKIN